jgi:hypothetical protein
MVCHVRGSRQHLGPERHVDVRECELGDGTLSSSVPVLSDDR